MSFRVRQARRAGFQQSRKLTFEGLEKRCMLSATPANVVLAWVNAGGDLMIRGDKGPNSIQVTQTAANSFTITGFVTANGQTTIENKTTDATGTSLTFDHVTRDVRIDMYDGNDEVQVVGQENGETVTSALVVPQDLVVNMGSKGDKHLAVDAVNVGRNMLLKAGKGQDLIDVGETSVGGKMSVNAGQGDEFLAISNTQVTGDATLKSGKGDDLLDMVNFTVGGALNVHSGQGNNVVLATLNTNAVNSVLADFAAHHASLFAVAPGAATEMEADLTAAIGAAGSSFTAHSAQFKSGTGEDFIDIAHASITQDLTVKTGDDADIVGLANSTIGGDASIDTGSNDDFVGLVGLRVTGKLELKTGAGNDVVSAAGRKNAIDDAFADYAANHPSADLTALNAQLDFNLTLLATPFSFKADNAHFTTGGGDDHLWITHAHVTNAFNVKVGGGNDQVTFTDNSFTSALLDGGGGTNTVTASGNLGTLTNKHFV